MCLIIASERGELPDRQLVRNAFEDNPDGFGAVWTDGGILRTYKTFKLKKALALLPTLEGNPYVMHFRLATHGRVDIENTHPFKVTRHLFMAHNGVVDWAAVKGSARSDSWHLSRVLAGDLGRDHRAQGFANMLPGIEAAIGPWNKLAFLRSDGEMFIANERTGLRRGGLWLSNGYSLPTQRIVKLSAVAPSCSPAWTAGDWNWSDHAGTLPDDETSWNDDPAPWDQGDECDSCLEWSSKGHARCVVDGLTLNLCRECRAEFFGEGL